MVTKNSHTLVDWIESYPLFLFDFDGLLVNTEEIHFAAYQRMCSRRGFELEWGFSRFCLAAHHSATGLKEQIYADIPQLLEVEPIWDVLYAEKKQAYIELLNEGAVHLMPGVERLLEILQEARVKRCVVTHSPSEQIELIRRQNPQLDSIPVWVTREDYHHPKPHPEPYLKAIQIMGCQNEKAIGFEDTSRGLQSLRGTMAQPVLVCSKEYPGLEKIVMEDTIHLDSFNDLFDHKSLA